MTEQKKPTIEERISALEKQKEEIIANFHRVEGALIVLREIKEGNEVEEATVEDTVSEEGI